MTRVSVDTVARAVRATLAEHHPGLTEHNLIIVLARVSALEHRAMAAPGEREPQPLTPAEFRSRTAAIDMPDDDHAAAIDDEIDALVDAMDAVETPTVLRASSPPVAALTSTPGTAKPQRSRRGPGNRKKRRFKGVWEKLRAFLEQHPKADWKTAYEAIRRQFGGDFIAHTNFKQNYWNKL